MVAGADGVGDHERRLVAESDDSGGANKRAFKPAIYPYKERCPVFGASVRNRENIAER